MKKTVLAILLTALVAPLAVSQQPYTSTTDSANCPVLILSYTMTEGEQTDKNFYVDFKNNTEKTVEGVKFTLYILDSVGDLHETLEAPQFTEFLKPGKSTHEFARIDPLNRYLSRFTKSGLFLAKVRFSDGTTWVRDKYTKGCVSARK